MLRDPFSRSDGAVNPPYHLLLTNPRSLSTFFWILVFECAPK